MQSTIELYTASFKFKFFLNNLKLFQNNLLQNKLIHNDIKKYFEFCTIFRLKQLIEVASCVCSCSSAVIDHILVNFLNKP